MQGLTGAFLIKENFLASVRSNMLNPKNQNQNQNQPQNKR